MYFISSVNLSIIYLGFISCIINVGKSSHLKPCTAAVYSSASCTQNIGLLADKPQMMYSDWIVGIWNSYNSGRGISTTNM